MSESTDAKRHRYSEQDVVSGIRELLMEIGVSDHGTFEENDQIDLREYIDDSMAFIAFIVALEEKFDIVFPNEMITCRIIQLYGLVE